MSLCAPSNAADAVFAYLSLGSNLGDRFDFLTRAQDLLHDTEGIEVVRCSPVYETEPVGYADQDRFLNCCVCVKTTLRPHELLGQTSRIETMLLRERTIRFGPRTIDIDILLYGDEEVHDETLIIPHERMWERAFALVPLLEIYEGNPKTRAKIETALALCDTTDIVKMEQKL